MGNMEDLRVRQLDDTLIAVKGLWTAPTPLDGWVRTIRETLGMSLRQLASRTGMSKTGVASAEKSEARGSIQLETLRRLADGLDCDVAYALVPRRSLRASLEAQAEKKAGHLVSRVSDSMDLESQGIAPNERQIQKDGLAKDILRTRGRDFWDD